MYTIALAGNPNCGKTALFNSLTDSSFYTGNRPGVTVEAKNATLKFNREIEILALSTEKLNISKYKTTITLLYPHTNLIWSLLSTSLIDGKADSEKFKLFD